MIAPHRSRLVARDAVLVAFVALAVGVAGSWRPSFWYDEVATIHVSTRDPDDLRLLLVAIDAVHGLYYAGMHYWFEAFGVSEFSARLPSALAVALAAAGVVVLGVRWGSRRLGLVSGLLFAILPRVGWAALEARSYALTAAAAVWLTVLLVTVPDARSRLLRVAGWTAYAVLLAASILLFVYAGLMIPAHLLAIALSGRLRRSWWGWSVATLVAAVSMIPFLRFAEGQRSQISWIPSFDADVARSALVGQWFLGAPGLAVGFAFLIVVAAGVSLRRPGDGTWRRVLPVALPWAIVPTAALIGASVGRSSIYIERYLTFTTPAVALVAGLALTRLTTRWWTTMLALIVAAALALPGQLAQRTSDAKPGRMDFSEVNRFAESHVDPGDCVLFGAAAWNPAPSQRLVEDVDPDAFTGVRDIGLRRDAVEVGMLWDEELPVADLAEPLSTCETLWYFTDRERAPDAADDALPPYRFEGTPEYRAFSAAGLNLDQRWSFTMSQVILLRADGR